MKKANRGEWAEIAARLWFLVEGAFLDIVSKTLVPFDSIVDRNQFGKETVHVPIGGRKNCPVSQSEARSLLRKGLDIIRTVKGAKGSFENEPLRKLCELLDVRCEKAVSNQKEDMIFRRKGERDQAYFAESTSSANASFVNAAKTTRITFKVKKPKGGSLSVADRESLIGRYGRGKSELGTKALVQEMYGTGYTLEYARINHPGFRSATEPIGHAELAHLEVDYLTEEGVRKIDPILAKHGSHTHPDTFKKTQKSLLNYIRECIMMQSPTGKGKGGAFARSGMILIDGQKVFLCRADGVTWWNEQVEEGGAFDTPSAGKHDYGYCYADGDDVLFDCGFGIRGSFTHLLEENLLTDQPSLLDE